MKPRLQAFFHAESGFFRRNASVLRRLCVILLVCSAVMVCLVIAAAAVRNYRLNKQVNKAAAEISLLVRNIRTLYASSGENVRDIEKALVASGAVAADRAGNIKNFLGGDIAVIRGPAADNIDGERRFFILSYRGLSHDICVKLSGLKWGGSRAGLITESVGNVDNDGNDSAFVNADYSSVREIRIRDSGRTRYVRQHLPEIRSAASPYDVYTVYPLPEKFSVSGCSCGSEDTCSFALRYSFYL